MQHPLSEFRTVLEEKLTGWNLPAELADEIEGHSTAVTFEKGAIVFLHGAPANLVFWLRKGFVKLYLPHANGNRTLIAVARPGEPLGIVANVDADGRSSQIFEAQALTKCSLGLFSREHMTSLLRKLDHETVIQLLGKLNATWSALFERYAGFIGLSFRERLEIVFKDLGDRFGVEDRRGTLVILELSQEHLAEMIGSSRPMVSKVVGDMVDEGLLARSEQQRFILLHQTERQSKLASSSEVTRSAGAIGASKSPPRMAVRLSIPAGGHQSRVTLSGMKHSSDPHNV
jgi:CRP/FNR family transcriptional regulator, cyclic AMP receptor protein